MGLRGRGAESGDAVSFDPYLEMVARVCHEANRAWCEAQGDLSQPSWDDAPSWQRESAIEGVQFQIQNPDARPADQHEAWCEAKRAAGWRYGDTRDPVAKTHPCLVDYADLPHHQKKKDALFIAVVRALTWEGL